MPYAPYRLTCGNIVRTGNADSNGLVTMFLNTAETTASLQWGQLPTSSDASTSSSSSQTSQNDKTAYVYARQIIINPEPPSADARDYYNLYYLESTDSANAQAFGNDYPSTTVDVVHGNGLPKTNSSEPA
jgi:hypothetical protein